MKPQEANKGTSEVTDVTENKPREKVALAGVKRPHDSLLPADEVSCALWGDWKMRTGKQNETDAYVTPVIRTPASGVQLFDKHGQREGHEPRS